MDGTILAAVTPAKIGRVRRAAGGMQRLAAGRAAARKPGPGTIGRRAGFVRDGLARATGFPLKMRERARERWLANMR